jgi:hypothetical protein
VRPREEVFNMRYQPPSRTNTVTFQGVKYNEQEKLGAAIQKAYKIRNTFELTSCETCHR